MTYIEEDFQQLIIPTLSEFSPHRWNEFTTSMLIVYRLTSKETHIRSFEYEALGFKRYQKTMVSERWYVAVPKVGNPYVFMFCFMCTTEETLARKWIETTLGNFREFVGGSEFNLVWKHNGRSW